MNSFCEADKNGVANHITNYDITAKDILQKSSRDCFFVSDIMVLIDSVVDISIDYDMLSETVICLMDLFHF